MYYAFQIDVTVTYNLLGVDGKLDGSCEKDQVCCWVLLRQGTELILLISGQCQVEGEEEGETTLLNTGRHYQGTVNDGSSSNCHQKEQNFCHPRLTIRRRAVP